MRAIPYLKPGSEQALKICEWPDPTPKNDEVLIEVRAFGVNFADIMARKGQYQDAPPMPFICGYEVSGVIKEIGSQVKNFKKGDKVLALTNFGGYSELAVTKESACFLLPDNLSFAEGASIPVNFITAFHALHQTGTLIPGTRVLIHAVAGGVGLASVQLAKLAGCEIFGTASSEEKLKLAVSWGVDHPINYSKDDFETAVSKITSGSGIDIVLDSLGGKNILKSLKVLRAHGRVICFGASSLSERGGLNALKVIPEAASMLFFNLIPLLLKSQAVYGVNMKRLSEDRADLINIELSEIMNLFSQKKLKTIISKEYSWKNISQAHQELQSRKSVGKIVLLVD